jgi:hypothetical protein
MGEMAIIYHRQRSPPLGTLMSNIDKDKVDDFLGRSIDKRKLINGETLVSVNNYELFGRSFGPK